MLGEDVRFEQNWMWRKNLLHDTLEKIQESRSSVIWRVKPSDAGDKSKSILLGPMLRASFHQQSPSDLNEFFVFSFQITRPVFLN
jgi:hypothetical protein